MRKKLTTVIEITESHVKFLQTILLAGKINLMHCHVSGIMQHSDEEITQSISSSLSASKTRSHNIITVVPRRFVIQRHISLPSHDEEEIKKMVALQIVKQVPYPKEDIVVDHITLHKDAGGYAKVLVIAVHKEIVGRYLKIFQDAGLHLNILTLSSEGLLNLSLYRERRNRQKTGESNVVINVDSNHTEICFFNEGKLLFSRSINYGAKDLNSEHIDVFIEQIHLTVNAYQKEKISDMVSRITLFSPLKDIMFLKTRLESEYKIIIDAVNPLDEVSHRKEMLLPEALEKEGVSLTVGLGLGLADHRKMINLLPVEVSDTWKVKQKRREWMKAGLLSALIMALVMGIFYLSAYRKSQSVEQLAAMVEETDQKVSEVRERSNRLDILKEKLSPKETVMEIISALYAVTPRDISYRLVQLDEKRALTLQGMSENSADVNNLQQNLVQSPIFDNVTLQYATKRKMFRGVEVTDFKIICQVAVKSAEKK